MNAQVALDEFKQGLDLLRQHYPGNALKHLARAVELERENPYYLSFFGLTLARALGKWADAEKLCDKAVALKRNEPRFYLNLAEVYSEAGRKRDAVNTLALGLECAGHHPDLVRALGRLRDRRPPVLPFLGRSNFLNMQIGRLRHRLIEFWRQQGQAA